MQLKTTTIVRQRGQLTIPNAIRKHKKWTRPGSVVTVSSETNKIVIKPYSQDKKDVDWKKLWKQMKRIRAFKGKGKPISSTEFLIKDRQTHF